MKVSGIELNAAERYIAFICEEIPTCHTALLKASHKTDNGELAHVKYSKVEPKVWQDVNIEVVGKYKRSAKFKLTFDKYVVEDIFYMSRHKSPDAILEECYKKIDKIVNKAFIEDDRAEEIQTRYNERINNFNNSLLRALRVLDERKTETRKINEKTAKTNE
jgi:hypothetical protein